MSLCITHRWSETVLFGSCFIPALGFSFILLFLHLIFLKVVNFQMWLTKSRATWPLFEKEVKYLSRVTTDKRIATKQKPLLISATYHKVDQAQDQFPGCISLISISSVRRTSSFLRFTDFLLVAYSAKFKSKRLQNIKVGAVKMA